MYESIFVSKSTRTTIGSKGTCQNNRVNRFYTKVSVSTFINVASYCFPDFIFPLIITDSPSDSGYTHYSLLILYAYIHLQNRFVFDNSSNNQALMVAGKALTKLVTTHWNNFTANQRVDVRNYILSYLANKGQGMEQYVLKHLVLLVCRITKLGWFDDPRHRDLVKEVTKFLQATIEHCIIGLRILNELVQDMYFQLKKQSSLFCFRIQFNELTMKF